MPELIEPQDTNSKIADRLNEEVKEAVDKFNEKQGQPTVLSGTIPAGAIGEIESPQQILENIQKVQAGAEVPKTPSAIPLETVKKNRAKSKAPQTTGKGTSVQDSIAKMKEKIVLLEYVDSLKVPEVPTGLSKDGREILLQIGKDQEVVKNRLIQAIGKL